MRNALAVAIVGSLLVLCAGIATAAAPSTVKSDDLWYWSVDSTDNAFLPTAAPGTPLTAASSASTWKITRDLGLSAVQLRELRSRLAGPSVLTAVPKPLFADVTVIFEASCRGIGTSIVRGQPDVRLYHRFRCTISGAAFKRVAKLNASIKAARAKIKASAQPVSEVLINALVTAYSNLARYQAAGGDPVVRQVTLVVTGRRDSSIVA